MYEIYPKKKGNRFPQQIGQIESKDYNRNMHLKSNKFSSVIIQYETASKSQVFDRIYV